MRREVEFFCVFAGLMSMVVEVWTAYLLCMDAFGLLSVKETSAFALVGLSTPVGFLFYCCCIYTGRLCGLAATE